MMHGQKNIKLSEGSVAPACSERWGDIYLK